MKKVWEFFENLNDVVYVADIDTHELVYMNRKTLEVYNFSSVTELQGKKCYELLQNNSVPCAMCNNDKLSENQFVEWQYYNPIVGKSYVIKDTMIEYDGRRYRFEIAIDNSVQEQRYKSFLNQQNQEALANEGMKLALKADAPDKAIDIMLEYLGKALKGDRTYIFEKNISDGDDNTYEWVANGVTPEIDNLQNLPPEICSSWYSYFAEGKTVVLDDIEQLREDNPVQYTVLKNQGIHSVVVVPLYDDMKILGFYGVDNPHGESLEYAENMLQIIGYFIVSLLRRRNLFVQMEEMSYSDQLTKLGNRFGMDKYMSGCSRDASIGIVFCDITGLKHINDTKGHLEGDKHILNAAESLRRKFEGYGLFRIGGDELLAICSGIGEEELYSNSRELKTDAEEHNVVLAVGAVWRRTAEENLDTLLGMAEKLMYEDKSEYYERLGIDRRR